MGSDLFDRSVEYDSMLEQGLRLTGEDKGYYMRGRVADLRKQLGDAWQPQRILDFGCGTGDTTAHLAEVFPRAFVLGIDTAERAVQSARERHGGDRVAFGLLRDFNARADFDLCYVNGVFHHIRPADRPATLRTIHAALVPRGRFAFMENNPWNPGTRLVMSRISFDADAVPLNVLEARALLQDAGFETLGAPRFLFYFPRRLALLRFAEQWLTRVPLGGQYYLLVVKA